MRIIKRYPHQYHTKKVQVDLRVAYDTGVFPEKTNNQYYPWRKEQSRGGGEGHKNNGEVRSHTTLSTSVKCTPNNAYLMGFNVLKSIPKLFQKARVNHPPGTALSPSASYQSPLVETSSGVSTMTHLQSGSSSFFHAKLWSSFQQFAF